MLKWWKAAKSKLWTLIKLKKNQKLQIDYGNEKLGTILNQVNAPENSLQQIANTQSGFQPLASIITERLDNLQIDESISYLREETKEESQEDTTENNADEPLNSLQRDSQSKEDKTKYTVELKPYIHWEIYCKRDSTSFTSKYEFKHS